MATTKLSVNVEIHPPDLKLSPSLRYLDLEELSRAAKAEIPIGEIDGGCCMHKVFASVRKGRVVGIYPEECPKDERTRLSKENARLVARAIRRARAKRRGGRKLPLPVATFFSSRALAQQITVETLTCVRICILGACITCCRRTDIPDSEVTCGHLTIDTTKPS